MDIYLVRPRKFRISAAVSLSSTTLQPEHRAAQVKRVKEARLDDPVDKEIGRWVDEAEGSGTVKKPEKDERRGGVTGTRLLRMSEEEADRLANEVRGVSVLRNQPFHLIRPKRRTTGQAAITSKDLWHLRAVGLTAARRAGFRGEGRGVTVAVLDTGIHPAHPEIQGKVKKSVRFSLDDPVQVQTGSEDTDGHGTHVAGLVAGSKVGIAPGADLYNGIMIPQGAGSLSDFVLAIEWAAGEPNVGVMNMSAGIPGFVQDILPDSIDTMLAVGVLPVVATGNEGRGRTRSPGNYDAPLSVGASNERGRVAGFSSSGTMNVDNHVYSVPDVVAPGEAVTSCVMEGGYEAWDGTSMATPIVSGIAALALEHWPEISPLDLMEEIYRSCESLNEPAGRQGEGLVTLPEELRPPRGRAQRRSRSSRKKKAKARKKSSKKVRRKAAREKTAAKRSSGRKKKTSRKKPSKKPASGRRARKKAPKRKRS